MDKAPVEDSESEGGVGRGGKDGGGQNEGEKARKEPDGDGSTSTGSGSSSPSEGKKQPFFCMDSLSLNPAAPLMDKIVLYETKTRFYVVGSARNEASFRVLKIDRTSPYAISILDDHVRYSRRQLEELLVMIDEGNKASGGLERVLSAFGIFGMVRFLEGYYIIFITKRRRVALIGAHHVYKIEDTVMIPVASGVSKLPKNEYESRYVKIFQNVDLSSNFYYSYTYDLTHSLQYNMIVNTKILANESKHHPKTGSHFNRGNEVESRAGSGEGAGPGQDGDSNEDVPDLRPPYNNHFAWNHYLLGAFCEKVRREWVLPVIHGFFAQANISVLGRPIYVTLIARRLRHMAGTRFLKRGVSDYGYVANDVESEQIVHDSTLLSHNFGKFTSFVQMRGSIPLYWSQENSNMAPKRPINLDRPDPFGSAASVHFDSLFKRYGTPIVILNLVKMKEKKPRESVLAKEFCDVISNLNQFLPKEHFIEYIGFDMAKCSKSNDGNVIGRLAVIAENVLSWTGFFHSGPQLFSNYLNAEKLAESQAAFEKVGGRDYSPYYVGRKQTGILRTNCIDCLDRTNVAEFVVGKCALGHQLYALGVISEPSLEFDSDAVRLLEEMYEDHGDTIALQYGGSQLVNTMETYRKISPWTSHSRDILNSIHRYYSNSFTDFDKQGAINLFLGIYVPKENSTHLWDLDSDFFHHNCEPSKPPVYREYTKWWSDSLPGYEGSEADNPSQREDCFFYDQADFLYDAKEHRTISEHEIDDVEKKFKELGSRVKSLPSSLLCSGATFKEFYRPDVLVSFREHFCLNMMSTSRKLALTPHKNLYNGPNTRPLQTDSIADKHLSDPYFDSLLSPDNTSPFYDVNELSPFKVRSRQPERQTSDKRFQKMDEYSLRALDITDAPPRNLNIIRNVSKPDSTYSSDGAAARSAKVSRQLMPEAEATMDGTLKSVADELSSGLKYVRLDQYITTNTAKFYNEPLYDNNEEEDIGDFAIVDHEGNEVYQEELEYDSELSNDLAGSFKIEDTSPQDITNYHSFTQNRFPVCYAQDRECLYPDWVGEAEEYSEEDNDVVDMWAEDVEEREVMLHRKRSSTVEDRAKEAAFEKYISLDFMFDKLPDTDYVEYLNTSKFSVK
eukprot:Nk52_evm17s262 gene=Nk52_evmTU17s262